jgi:Anion-transporting ATPase
MPKPLLERSLIVVTGKGGVGRTTTCAALAVLGARAGRRTIVCEVGEQHRIPRLWDERGGHEEEIELADNLWATSIDPQLALKDYLASQMPGPFVRLLADSRTFQYLYAAAPGARELVTMGGIWDLVAGRLRKRSEQYDLVIVDAPATGHAIGMLRTPKTFAEIARVGPIKNHANRIWQLFTDPRRTGYAAVATLADMPVNETLDLQERLHKAVGRPLELVVANGVLSRRFSPDELTRVARLDGEVPEAEAVELAASSHAARVRAQQTHLRRLRKGAEGDVETLPFVFTPEIGVAEVEGLADVLASKLARRSAAA